MKTVDGEHILCDTRGCTNKIPANAWSKIKADEWVQLKNGEDYCPEHHPEWYDAWTRKKKR